VILVVASIALGLALVGAVIPPTSILLIPLNLAFGAFVFPMYGQFVALANDWIAPQKRVAAASALILASSTGAVAAPVILGTAIELFGPGGYFLSLAAVLAVLVFYLGYRSQVREAVPLDRQSPFQPVLARSGAIAHSVSRWVRHPLAEWNRDAPTQKEGT
jgi:MFS family permease